MISSCLKPYYGFLLSISQRLSLRIYAGLVMWNSPSYLYLHDLMYSHAWEPLAYKMGTPLRSDSKLSSQSCHFLFWTLFFNSTRPLTVMWIPCNFIFCSFVFSLTYSWNTLILLAWQFLLSPQKSITSSVKPFMCSLLVNCILLYIPRISLTAWYLIRSLEILFIQRTVYK